MLPGLDGFRVLETLRHEGVDTPVLVLTARGDETDKVRGLRNGADDYVTKPFALRELLARVGALLRRAGRVATRSELLREVWGYQDCVVSRTLDTHVGELRRKLEDDPARPRHILTVRKTGYRLVSGKR
jgi:two-component system response regulator VicR